MSEPKTNVEGCVFCEIGQGKVPETELLYDDVDYAVFRDHRPAAEHHYLVIPKKHFEKITTLTKQDIPMIRRMEKIGMEVLSNRRRRGSNMEDILCGFHWPISIINHLHLHIIAPEQSMNFFNRKVQFSKMFFGKIESAIQVLENSEN